MQQPEETRKGRHAGQRDKERKREIYIWRGQESQRGLVPSKINDELLYRELEREVREREGERGVRKREGGG